MNKINYFLAAIALFLSHPLYSSPEGEANYAIAARFFQEVLNEGKIELLDELFAEDAKVPVRSGIEGFKQKIKGFISEKYQYEILEYVADEEKIYLKVRVAEPWPDYAIPSDSKKTHSLKIHHELMWIKDGKITELRFTPSLLDQLKELSGFQGSFEKMVKALSSK